MSSDYGSDFSDDTMGEILGMPVSETSTRTALSPEQPTLPKAPKTTPGILSAPRSGVSKKLTNGKEKQHTPGATQSTSTSQPTPVVVPKPVELYRLDFGQKHYGKTLFEADPHYVGWLIRNNVEKDRPGLGSAIEFYKSDEGKAMKKEHSKKKKRKQPEDRDGWDSTEELLAQWSDTTDCDVDGTAADGVDNWIQLNHELNQQLRARLRQQNREKFRKNNPPKKQE